jgi:hypothetical protein
MDLFIFLGMILSAVIISIIYRVYIIKSWIKHYCFYDLRSALPEADSVPIEGPMPITRTIDFTWEPSLWFKSYDKRAAIITSAAITALNEYCDFYKIYEEKLILNISIKAVKKSRFNRPLTSIFYGASRWGGEIFITIADKPVEKPIEKPVQKITVIYHSEEVPRIRQIMVCRDV